MAAIEFHLDDHKANVTVVLHRSHDDSNHTADPEGMTGDAKDDMGAMFYVVTVVTVYSLGMLFIVISFISRKNNGEELDAEVSSFLKGWNHAAKQAREDTVKRQRLQWPGNFIGLRLSSRTDSQQGNSENEQEMVSRSPQVRFSHPVVLEPLLEVNEDDLSDTEAPPMEDVHWLHQFSRRGRLMSQEGPPPKPIIDPGKLHPG